MRAWIYKIALPVAFCALAGAAEAKEQISLNSSNNVEVFYGIPIDLTLSKIKSLPYRAEVGYRTSEGEPYTTAVVIAADGVLVEISFDQDGKLWGMETASSNAIAPGGLRVGSRLSDVRAAWPEGKLNWGVEENQATVTFYTGTNLAFSFDPADMPPGALRAGLRGSKIPDLKVQSFYVGSAPMTGPEVCHPDFCQ